ncbi:Prp18-domain-containing protein [Ascodesmis nigricans]|uniref:Pre-mRNA-splicing factor 18 n=1 Tax=Ascodesmis nigricans TaxID=341454 RepID=A0A4S2N7Y8_9PEZI|nr:Prp18-domain-containing protein [Ascodesmis nigricans]
MDFASILSSEINKKRKTIPSTSASSEAEGTTSASTSPPPKKYLKRSELEAQRAAAYLAEQQRIERERQEKAAKKRAAEAEAAAEAERTKQKRLKLAEERRARLEAQNGGKKKDAEDETGKAGDEGGKNDEGESMTEEDAIKRLRELGLPATLFGESQVSRVKRLRREERKHSSATPPITVAPSLTEEEMKIDLEDVTANPEKVYTQLDVWFRLVLKEWKRALDGRPDSIKQSLQGRKAADAMRQADEYMKPLFDHFRKRDLQEVVFEKVSEIVVEAQKRRYVKANDVYLRLSIGNAAWPIGVTMVGIHERSAREKLHENRKEGGAHIMSDEVTRKFLQSIKRCLSFCQTRWPPEDPLQLMG